MGTSQLPAGSRTTRSLGVTRRSSSPRATRAASWTRAVEAEPLISSRILQTYRDVPPSTLDLRTTNSLAIAAWRQQIVVTGDPALDRIVEQLGPVEIDHSAFHSDGESAWLFSLQIHTAYGEEQLAAALAPTGTAMSEPYIAPRDDGQWTWLGSIAQIDFAFGFGDCFVGCGLHRVRAVVAPTGDAKVFDLGGVPLPEGVSLSPNTVPL